MDMVLNRSGIVFTLIAILISFFLFTVYFTEYTPKQDSLLPVVTNRIKTLDRFNDNFLKYSLEAMDISSFKALNGMVAYADEKKEFFVQFESAFLECLQNGTLDNGADVCPNMENGTLPYWLNQIVNVSREKLGMNITYQVLSVQVKQPLPYQIQVNAVLHYEIVDVFATINRTTNLQRLVSIEGLPDPLYAVLGGYNNTIKASPTREDQWDNNTLYLMIYNRTYRHHSDAPSLSMRFVGNLTNSSCCGVESMVSPDESLGYFQNKSFVDYIFWNDTQGCGGIPVQVVYRIDYEAYDPKFRLDPRHLAAYNIGSDRWIGACP